MYNCGDSMTLQTVTQHNHTSNTKYGSNSEALLWFLWFAIRFCFSSDQARSLLRASVLYLPVLLAMLMLDQSGIDSRTRETFAERATTADVPQEGTLNQQDTNILAARKVLSP